jgi:DNA-directed RNA polymerase specialized sigma24 family protein
MITDDVDTLVSSNDPLLAAFLRADDAAVEPEIEQLIVRVVWPAIERVSARYLGPRSALQRHDAEDVTADVTLRLLGKLRRARVHPGEAIQDVVKYVSMLAYNAINDHLRLRFPQRTRLKNRLRYVLTHDARFDLWNVAGAQACGLRGWNRSSDPLSSVPLEVSAATRVMRDRDRPADALYAMFRATGQPLELQAVVHFTAAIWHVVDLAPVDLDGTAMADPEETVTARMEGREFLRALWREILQLRPMQRKALLLNLRESAAVDATSLLVYTGTARFDDIAAALELSADELAALWDKLPLDDLRIAALLDIERQQVIGLRKAARARLQRRLFR